MEGERRGEHELAAVLTVEVLFRTEVEFVMNTARRCGLSDADAEDVTQEVFVAVQRRVHTLQSPEAVRPWLFTVTRRAAWALKGKKRRDEEMESLPYGMGEMDEEEPIGEDRLLGAEMRRELLELLETIEPGRRAVLVMHVLDEIPMDEVAEVLGIRVSTAYNRLRIARTELRIAYARKAEFDELGIAMRRWNTMLTVRDPNETYYGKAAIGDAMRERMWERVRAAIEGAYGSLEAAEVEGLRVVSPLWRKNPEPLEYPKLKRPPKLAKSELIPSRYEPADLPITGCRILSVAGRTFVLASPPASLP